MLFIGKNYPNFGIFYRLDLKAAQPLCFYNNSKEFVCRKGKYEATQAFSGERKIVISFSSTRKHDFMIISFDVED